MSDQQLINKYKTQYPCFRYYKVEMIEEDGFDPDTHSFLGNHKVTVRYMKYSDVDPSLAPQSKEYVKHFVNHASSVNMNINYSGDDNGIAAKYYIEQQLNERLCKYYIDYEAGVEGSIVDRSTLTTEECLELAADYAYKHPDRKVCVVTSIDTNSDVMQQLKYFDNVYIVDSGADPLGIRGLYLQMAVVTDTSNNKETSDFVEMLHVARTPMANIIVSPFTRSFVSSFKELETI